MPAGILNGSLERAIWCPGGSQFMFKAKSHFHLKNQLSSNMDLHYKDMTVSSLFYIHNGNPYMDEKAIINIRSSHNSHIFIINIPIP